MEITYKNYRLKQEYGRFNVIKDFTSITKETNEEYENYKIIGFGYTFEGAIKAIITDIFEQKDETLTLQGFIQAYRNEVNELKQVIVL